MREVKRQFELEEQAKLDNIMKLAKETQENQESETYESAARLVTGMPYIMESDGVALEEDEGLLDEEDQNNFRDLYMEDQASQFYTEEYEDY